MTTPLTAFADDPRLAQLDALLRRPLPFNILTALGVRRQELRHSALLAYLLDPRQPHGLSDHVARVLLQRVAPLLAEPLELESLALKNLNVQREWSFIDILVESPADKLVIIIENKVDSGEHSNQLTTYYQKIRKHRPGWRVIGIYLTLDGAPPARAQDRAVYAPLGYADVAEAFDLLADLPGVALDVPTLLRHYAQQIRSVLVPDQDSDQARLARRLYMDHQPTAEAMLRARDARMRMIERCFDELFTGTVRAQPDLLKRDAPYENKEIPRWHVRFAPPEWYSPELQVSTPWNRTRLVMMFQFMQSPHMVHFDLAVGPAPRSGRLRERLYSLARDGVHPFFPAYSDPSNIWFSIYARTVFSSESNYFAETSDDAIRRAIRANWDDFLERDLPVIRTIIRHEILGQNWDS